jgi:hypothetical protein
VLEGGVLSLELPHEDDAGLLVAHFHPPLQQECLQLQQVVQELPPQPPVR